MKRRKNTPSNKIDYKKRKLLEAVQLHRHKQEMNTQHSIHNTYDETIKLQQEDGAYNIFIITTSFIIYSFIILSFLFYNKT